MAQGYRALLRTPAIARVVAAGTVSGIAVQGMPVALVLLGRDATGSFAGGSALLAAATLGAVGLAPARGRMVDRRGPVRMLPLLAVASAMASALLVLTAEARAPVVPLVLLAFLGGACSPPVTAVMRNVLRDTVTDDALRHTAFGLLTVLQEVGFFGGPLLAGAIIGIASPAAAVATVAAVGLVAALAFVTAPATRAHADGHGAVAAAASPGWSALGSAGMRTVVCTAALAGAAFGLLDVALPAAARHAGSAGAAGVLLSALALGIGVGGFAYGLRPPRRAAGSLYGPLCMLAAAGLAPLAFAGGRASLAAMVLLLLVSGLLFAPVTTCQLALIDDVAPRNRSTEAMSVLSAAYGTFAAVGAQAAGALIDGEGLRAPFVAACCAIAVGAVVATARRGTLAPRAMAPARIERA